MGQKRACRLAVWVAGWIRPCLTVKGQSTLTSRDWTRNARASAVFACRHMCIYIYTYMHRSCLPYAQTTRQQPACVLAGPYRAPISPLCQAQAQRKIPTPRFKFPQIKPHPWHKAIGCPGLATCARVARVRTLPVAEADVVRMGLVSLVSKPGYNPQKSWL